MAVEGFGVGAEFFEISLDGVLLEVDAINEEGMATEAKENPSIFLFLYMKGLPRRRFLANTTRFSE